MRGRYCAARLSCCAVQGRPTGVVLMLLLAGRGGRRRRGRRQRNCRDCDIFLWFCSLSGCLWALNRRRRLFPVQQGAELGFRKCKLSLVVWEWKRLHLIECRQIVHSLEMRPYRVRAYLSVQRLGQPISYAGHEEVFVYSDRFQSLQRQEQLNFTLRVPFFGFDAFLGRRHGHFNH